MPALEKTVSALTAATDTDDADLLPLAQDVSGDMRSRKATLAQVRAPLLRKTGGTMTGPIVLHDVPVLPTHAATKAYVDAIAQGVAEDAIGERLDDYGTVDRTGATNMSTLINAAFVATAALKRRLYISKGTYRLDATLTVQNDLDVLCHPQAEFVAYFDGGGRSGGLVSMTTAQWNAAPAAAPRNIRIKGGIWRRFGSVSANGQDWEGPISDFNRDEFGEYTIPTMRGYIGSIFAFWAENVELTDMRITGYNRGRAIQPAGRRWLLDSIDISNPDNYLNLPCPGIGGTGAVRWYSGGPMLARNIRAVCGDDVFQAVPAATDNFGVDVESITYENCYGYSVKARVCVVALTVPNALPEDLQFSQTVGIRNVTFRGIRGSGKIACAVYNSDSTGTLGTILFDDVRLGINRDLDDAAAPYAIEFLGSDRTAGAGPIHLREFELLNRIEGGLRHRGTEINEILCDTLIIPAPDNADTLFFAVQAMDAKRLVMRGGSIVGPPTGTNSLVFLGRNDEAFSIGLARFDDVEFINVPSLKYAIQCSTYGALRMEVNRCKALPIEGVTDARAIAFGPSSVSALITGNQWGALGSVPYLTVPATASLRDNIVSSAAVSGIVHQHVAVGTTVAWNGRATLIRLTSTADSTLETLSLPEGYGIRDTPTVILMGVSNYTITIIDAGNMKPSIGAAIALNEAITFVYDFILGAWIQVGGVDAAADAAAASDLARSLAETARDDAEVAAIAAAASLAQLNIDVAIALADVAQDGADAVAASAAAAVAAAGDDAAAVAAAAVEAAAQDAAAAVAAEIDANAVAIRALLYPSLLLEDGGALLLEDDSFTLLESQPLDDLEGLETVSSQVLALAPAAALVGDEAVPAVQGGVLLDTTVDAIAARAVASGSAAPLNHGHSQDNFREWAHRMSGRFEDKMLTAVLNTAMPHYAVSAADLPGRIRLVGAGNWADFEDFPLNDEILVDSVGSGTLYSGDSGANWRGTSSKMLTLTTGQVALVVKSQGDIAAFLLPTLTATTSLTPPVPADLRPYLGQSWAERTKSNGLRGAQAYRVGRSLTRFLKHIDCAVGASAMAGTGPTGNFFWRTDTNAAGPNFQQAVDAINAAQAAYPSVAITDAVCLLGSGDLDVLQTGAKTPAILIAAYLACFAALRTATGLPGLRIWITPLTSTSYPGGTPQGNPLPWHINRFCQMQVVAQDANCRRGPELYDIPQPWQDGHNSVHAQTEYAARVEHWIAREKNSLSNGRGVKITGFTRLAAKQFKFTLDRFGGDSSSGLNVNPMWKPSSMPLGFGICATGDLWSDSLEFEDFDWDGDNLILNTTTDSMTALPVYPYTYNHAATFRPTEVIRVYDRNLALSGHAAWQPLQALAHNETGGVFTPNFSI